MIVLSNPGILCGNFKRPSSQLIMHTRFVQSLHPVYVHPVYDSFVLCETVFLINSFTFTMTLYVYVAA